MDADHSFYVKTIETHVCTFLPLNISAIGTVPPVPPVSTALYYQYMHMDGIAFILNGPVLPIIHLDVMPARRTV